MRLPHLACGNKTIKAVVRICMYAIASPRLWQLFSSRGTMQFSYRHQLELFSQQAYKHTSRCIKNISFLIDIRVSNVCVPCVHYSCDISVPCAHCSCKMCVLCVHCSCLCAVCPLLMKCVSHAFIVRVSFVCHVSLRPLFV